MAQEKKQFILPEDLARAVDSIAEEMGGKGNLKRVGAAAMLMFVHARKQDRSAYILWADGIAMGSASIDRPPLISRLASMGRMPGRPEDAVQFDVRLEPWNPSCIENVRAAKIVDPADFASGAVKRNECIPILDPVRGAKPIAPEDGDYDHGASEDFLRFHTDDPLACAIHVEGRAMMPEFKHGDLAIVSPGKESAFRSGMMGVVLFRVPKPYVFRVVERKRKGEWALRALNEDFDPEIVASDAVKAIYPVVGGVRR